MRNAVFVFLVVVIAVTSVGQPAAQLPEIPQGPHVANIKYSGRNGYIEYVPGTLPLIFSAPHGGTLAPAEIRNRTATACGLDPFNGFETVRDSYTDVLLLEIRKAFFDYTGGHTPHIVLNRLSRTKLDPSRVINAGACNDVAGEIAWHEYHGFIDLASETITSQFGVGWYTDLHGHGHAVQRIELGYNLSADDLRLADGVLDGATRYERNVTFREFSRMSPASFSALLRGPRSLGTVLADAGYPAVPSLQDPSPAIGEKYFEDGYSTYMHGCRQAGRICGVQMEINSAPRQPAARPAFVAALVRAYADYLGQFGIEITQGT